MSGEAGDEGEGGMEPWFQTPALFVTSTTFRGVEAILGQTNTSDETARIKTDGCEFQVLAPELSEAIRARVDASSSVFDIWSTYFPTKLVQLACRETNRYAAAISSGEVQRPAWAPKKGPWPPKYLKGEFKPFTESEILTLFGVSYIMGVFRMPVLDYWKNDEYRACRIVAEAMSRERFKQVWACISFDADASRMLAAANASTSPQAMPSETPQPLYPPPVPGGAATSGASGGDAMQFAGPLRSGPAGTPPPPAPAAAGGPAAAGAGAGPPAPAAQHTRAGGQTSAESSDVRRTADAAAALASVTSSKAQLVKQGLGPAPLPMPPVMQRAGARPVQAPAAAAAQGDTDVEVLRHVRSVVQEVAATIGASQVWLPTKEVNTNMVSTMEKNRWYWLVVDTDRRPLFGYSFEGAFFKTTLPLTETATLITRTSKTGAYHESMVTDVRMLWDLFVVGADNSEVRFNYPTTTRRCLREWHFYIYWILDMVLLRTASTYGILRDKRPIAREFTLECGKQILGYAESLQPAKKRKRKRSRERDEPQKRQRCRGPLEWPDERFEPGGHWPKHSDRQARCRVCFDLAKTDDKATASRTSFVCVKCNVPLCLKRGKECYVQWHTLTPATDGANGAATSEASSTPSAPSTTQAGMLHSMIGNDAGI